MLSNTSETNSRIDSTRALTQVQRLLAATWILWCAPWAWAQNGTVDTSYGVLRIDSGFNGGSRQDEAMDAILQADGKLVVLSKSEWSGLDTDVLVLRRGVDGSVDGTFGGGSGQVRISLDAGGTDQDSGSTLLQADDGDLILGGWAASDADQGYWLRRLEPDGSIDPTFVATSLVTEPGVDLEASKLIGEPGGGGSFLVLVQSRGNSSSNNQLYRYQADGSGRTLVHSFGAGYYYEEAARAADGTLWLAGWFDHPAGDEDVALARITAQDVVTEFTYHLDLGGDDNDGAVAVATFGTEVFAAVHSDSDTGQTASLLKVDQDGVRDPDFGSNGVLEVVVVQNTSLRVEDVIATEVGLLVAGSGSDPGTTRTGFVRKFWLDDHVDVNFGLDSMYLGNYDLGGDNSDGIRTVLVDARDRLLVVGESSVSANDSDLIVARLQNAFFTDDLETADTARWSSAVP